MRSRMYRRGGAALLALGLLSACAAEVPPLVEPPQPAEPLPVLTAEQVDTVLAEVGQAVLDGDATSDPAALEPRFAGPALELRSAEYALAQATEGESAPGVLWTQSQVEVVTVDEEWPRTMIAVTEQSEENAILLLGLSQASPREPYQLLAWSRMLPGVSTPEVAAPEVGSEQLTGEADGLVSTPQETLQRFADVLANPEDESAGAFADDPYRTFLAEELTGLREGAEVAGEVDFAVAPGEPYVVMATADGGAVAMATLETSLTFRKTVDGSELSLPAEMAALAGGAEIEDEAVATYRHMVTFSIPPEGAADPLVRLIGSHRVLTSVERTDG